MQKNSFIKLSCLEKSATRSRQKSRNIYVLLPDHQFTENVIFLFGFYEKIVGIMVMIFLIKNVCQVASKIFDTKCFLTNHLKHEVHKVTKYTLVEALSSCYVYFLRFLGFPD